MEAFTDTLPMLCMGFKPHYKFVFVYSKNMMNIALKGSTLVFGK